jgi:hypothetical protein
MPFPFRKPLVAQSGDQAPTHPNNSESRVAYLVSYDKVEPKGGISSITFSGNPSNSNSITVTTSVNANPQTTVTFEFVTSSPSGYQVLIGSSVTDTINNLINTVNNNTTLPFIAYSGGNNIVIFESKNKGVSSNTNESDVYLSISGTFGTVNNNNSYGYDGAKDFNGKSISIEFVNSSLQVTSIQIDLGNSYTNSHGITDIVDTINNTLSSNYYIKVINIYPNNITNALFKPGQFDHGVAVSDKNIIEPIESKTRLIAPSFPVNWEYTNLPLVDISANIADLYRDFYKAKEGFDPLTGNDATDSERAFKGLTVEGDIVLTGDIIFKKGGKLNLQVSTIGAITDKYIVLNANESGNGISGASGQRRSGIEIDRGQATHKFLDFSDEISGNRIVGWNIDDIIHVYKSSGTFIDIDPNTNPVINLANRIKLTSASDNNFTLEKTGNNNKIQFSISGTSEIDFINGNTTNYIKLNNSNNDFIFHSNKNIVFEFPNNAKIIWGTGELNQDQGASISIGSASSSVKPYISFKSSSNSGRIQLSTISDHQVFIINTSGDSEITNLSPRDYLVINAGNNIRNANDWEASWGGGIRTNDILANNIKANNVLFNRLDLNEIYTQRIGINTSSSISGVTRFKLEDGALDISVNEINGNKSIGNVETLRITKTTTNSNSNNDLFSRPAHFQNIRIANGITETGISNSSALFLASYGKPLISGVVNNVIGLLIQAGISDGQSGASGTIKQVRLISATPYAYSDANTNVIIDKLYGLYLGSKAGSATINDYWGIYQVDPDAKNYFAGRAGIGYTPDADTRFFLTVKRAALIKDSFNPFIDFHDEGTNRFGIIEGVTNEFRVLAGSGKDLVLGVQGLVRKIVINQSNGISIVDTAGNNPYLNFIAGSTRIGLIDAVGTQSEFRIMADTNKSLALGAGGSGNIALRISQNNNIGIGTNPSDSYKLEVSGNTKFNGLLTVRYSNLSLLETVPVILPDFTSLAISYRDSSGNLHEGINIRISEITIGSTTYKVLALP